jgi:carboxyl-terminal processing protease
MTNGAKMYGNRESGGAYRCCFTLVFVCFLYWSSFPVASSFKPAHQYYVYGNPKFDTRLVSRFATRMGGNEPAPAGAKLHKWSSGLGKVIAAASLTASLNFGLSIYPSNAVGETVFNEVWSIVQENYVDSTYNNHDWNEIKKDYTKRLELGADEHELTKKMLELLGDKYTRLLDRAYFESIWKFDAIGVGLLFQSDPVSGRIIVAGPPVRGSTAAKAGFQKGDLIYSINGKSTSGMTAMMLLDMMSTDENPTVTMEYTRVNGDKEGEKMTATLQRVLAEKATNPVEYYSKKLSNGKLLGYIRLSEFNAEAVPGVRQALVDLKKENVDEVVLDLRGNTGGGFQFALNIGGMFMDSKVMVTALGKGDERNVFKTSYPEGVLYKKPLVLLTDGLSASASEVLAGGLRDNCRATLAGDTTFGKGKIQAVFGLANGEGLTMTVAQYVTPNGNVIQSRGLQPDQPLSTMNAYVAMLTGPQLNKIDLEKVDFEKSEEVIRQCKTGE